MSRSLFRGRGRPGSVITAAVLMGALALVAAPVPAAELAALAARLSPA